MPGQINQNIRSVAEDRRFDHFVRSAGHVSPQGRAALKSLRNRVRLGVIVVEDDFEFLRRKPPQKRLDEIGDRMFAKIRRQKSDAQPSFRFGQIAPLAAHGVTDRATVRHVFREYLFRFQVSEAVERHEPKTPRFVPRRITRDYGRILRDRFVHPVAFEQHHRPTQTRPLVFWIEHQRLGKTFERLRLTAHDRQRGTEIGPTRYVLWSKSNYPFACGESLVKAPLRLINQRKIMPAVSQLGIFLGKASKQRLGTRKISSCHVGDAETKGRLG